MAGVLPSGGGTGGTAGVQSDPRQAASGMDPEGVDNDQEDKTGKEDQDLAVEEKVVRKRFQEYEEARKFDENYRKQVAIDRRYAAGTSDLSWAVTTNLIGAYIDILVALLYARNPDVSVSKAPQVDEDGTAGPAEDFPKTLQIVISQLWKKAGLKKAARKMVRAVLTTGEGWMKAIMVSEKTPQAQTYQTQLNDAKTLQARVIAQQELIEDPLQSPDDLEVEKARLAALIASLAEKEELAVEQKLVCDFVPTENIQVSTDVASISDYLDANWIGNEKYIKWSDALSTFPRLSDDDIKGAKVYYQKGPKELTTRDIDNVLPQGMLTAETAQAFTQSTSEQQSSKFVRSIEIWDRTDRTVYTIVEGVKKWAVEPFSPPYASSRFYPYFGFSFYEVDGERHPQSLAWRLYKLQDEFSSVRSNMRLFRERSIPAVLFNATAIDQTEARKISDAKIQELIPVRPTNPQAPLSEIFAAKPTAQYDPRVFDTAPILSDMERISGVQEALSAAMSGPGNPKTATEANIQQTGTNARTGSDRDNLEEMLTELAQYSAEQAIEAMPTNKVQRIAGAKAFWPFGMDIEDLFTLVEVDIEAGSTGKPRQGTDQQAWSQLLPILQQAIKDINQALALGDIPLSTALTNVIKETMLRFGDQSDPMRFIPQQPPPGSPGAGPSPPKPAPAPISISLRGELDPVTAAKLAQPDITQDEIAQIAQNAAAQASGQSAAGGTPPAPGPGPGAPPPGPGPALPH
jgi:hypothetical protein